MSIDCQYKVALEFGFADSVIELCLSTHVFHTAGDLVDYLDRHEKTLERLVKKKENEELRKETEWLYRETFCVGCLKNSRKFMTLPCCHFSLCEKCERKCFVCPFEDCKQSISCAIRVRPC